MKKWMYVISVGSMLAVFCFFYFSFLKEMEIRDQRLAAETARKLKEDEDRKAALEAKAREDANGKAAQRAADEAKKEAEKIAKWENAGKEIKDATDKYNAEADRLSKEAAKLEIQLDGLRKDREKANRETFELAKRVERTKIEKRNAELEIQRLTEMISKRAEASSMARPPVIPAPAKS